MQLVYDGKGHENPDSVTGFVAAAAPRAEFTRVLMVDPAHFQVRYEINPHMAGNAGTVNPDKARAEWDAIRAVYEKLGYDVLVMAGHPDYPDLVFAANQCLPVRGKTGPKAVLSAMAKPQRQGEVGLVRAFLEGHGFETCAACAGDGFLEGCGDALWHPGRNLIWGGHGFRTDLSVWHRVAENNGVAVIPLKLVDERCYHLDVCLMPIDQTTAFACRAAFDGESWARLKAGFANLIEADENETMNGFALNGHCPDGRNLLLPAGNPRTRAQAAALGLTVHELSTHEFQKSGGSIFCLKNMLP